MSNTRVTFGAILNTIQSTATMLTNTLDTVNTGVGMATTYVTDAADNQRMRSTADKESFLEDLVREKSYEESQSNLKVQKFCLQSADHKQFYEAAYTKYSNLLRKTQATA